MATRKESSWPPYTVSNRVITAAAIITTTTTTTTTKAVLIKFNLFIYDLCPSNTQRIDGVAMAALLLLLLLLLLLSYHLYVGYLQLYT